MRLDIVVTAIAKPYYIQIYTHGCHYNCPMTEIEGVWYSRFKGQQFKIADYTDDHTRLVNNRPL